MQRDFLKSEIINKAFEVTHQGSVIVGIVFILIFINQIKITTYNPRSLAGISDITKFLQKLNLIIISLRPIDTSKPPRLPISWRELYGHAIVVHMLSTRCPKMSPPSYQNTSTGTNRRGFNELRKIRAKC
jgi:hypothetical protein